jgi:hypothetical protein
MTISECRLSKGALLSWLINFFFVKTGTLGQVDTAVIDIPEDDDIRES